MEKCRRFHSSFVTDVTVKDGEAVLADSTRMRWWVDMSNADTAAQFKAWLKDVFTKGVAQTLTVFEYEDRGEEGAAEPYVTRFLNLPSGAMQAVNG